MNREGAAGSVTVFFPVPGSVTIESITACLLLSKAKRYPRFRRPGKAYVLSASWALAVSGKSSVENLTTCPSLDWIRRPACAVVVEDSPGDAKTLFSTLSMLARGISM
jgi:hypothetical protein